MKKRGFTLIELLAVIIILGILMLVAIPSISNYINNTRKNTYITTINEVIRGVASKAKLEEIELNDTDTTYYVPFTCVDLERGKAESPYGKFDPAYVAVTFDGIKHNFYFEGRDVKNMGVPTLTKSTLLTADSIISNVKEIDTSVALDATSNIVIYNDDCSVKSETKLASTIYSKDGQKMVVMTYDNQGGEGCSRQKQIPGEKWNKLCKPKNDRLKFRGWFTEENGQGEQITVDTVAEDNITVYAYWVDISATFDTGEKVNAKMKQISGYYNPITEEYDYSKHIVAIKYSEDEPSEIYKQEENIVSSKDSGVPIYMWYQGETIYWWSEDDHPCLNKNSKRMFAINYLASIKGLDRFDTSNVTDMGNMFGGTSFTSLDLRTFDTSKVTNMANMFGSCSNLVTLDISSFDTSNVTSMAAMFRFTEKLKNVDFSNFDTSKVSSMYQMFHWCHSLEYIDTSNWNVSSVKSFKDMFWGCVNLSDLDTSNWNTESAENMNQMFTDCHQLKELNLQNFNTSKVTDMSGMFYECTNLTYLDLSMFDTTKCRNMDSMFKYCYRIQELDLNNFYTPELHDVQHMFLYCTSLKKLNIDNLDTSHVRFFCYMFGYCSSLESLNISSFNTDTSESMFGFFCGCSSLKSLDVSSFNTSKVYSMYAMFANCSSLEYLDVSNFDTSNVEDMGREAYGDGTRFQYNGMFEGCSKLKSLDLSNWNTSKVTTMSYMFQGCSSLTSLDISNFDTSSLIEMAYMFGDCSNLTEINLGSINTSTVKYFNGLFYECSNLKTIYINNSFNTASLELNPNIFYGCNKLVGGSGTTWQNSMANDISYAKIDEGQYSPGLFTQKI